MAWRDILEIESPELSDRSAKSPPDDPFCTLSHYCHKDSELKNDNVIREMRTADREFSAQISRSGLLPKWRAYLFERVRVLTKFEGYSIEAARDEVVKMIPYYLRPN